MSSKKEEKSQAADKIKAAALSAAKGLSRAQAERAAAAAARNVNAYGQKEEGPSRWQERKEAKRQMYLMSTEKAVRLGERKNTKSTSGSVGGVASQCQKCFQTGHWTYECKNERVYISRPSRSQQLKNPKLRQKLMESYNMDNPEIQEVENGGMKDEKAVKKSKRKYRGDKKSGSDSEASVFDSDSGSSSATGSDYSSAESASSDSSSSDSEEDRRRKKRKQKSGKRRSKKRYSSSSEDSEDESSSDSNSDSDDRPSSRKKSRRHGKRH